MKWVIGDIHGCFKTLQALLDRIGPSKGDEIYFLGDLINRGSDSLKTIEFLHGFELGKVVLGNHDIALLAAAGGAINYEHNPCFKAILNHRRSEEWLSWLKIQPFIRVDNSIMVHAGLYPLWNLEKNYDVASQLHKWLSSIDDYKQLSEIWNRSSVVLHPDHIQTEIDLLAFGLNVFTRMRYLNEHKKLIASQPAQDGRADTVLPWFNDFEQNPLPHPIVFGHWAALQGKFDSPHVIGLDTGCVWGGQLTAMNLETKECIKQACLDVPRAWQGE